MGHYVKIKSLYYNNKIKRTIQKQRIKDFCMVLLFIFLLPYTCAILLSNSKIPINQKEIPQIGENDNLNVVLRKNFGTQKISFDEYLVGILACAIPGEYQAETIKAQAVILRSSCFYMMTNKTGIISEDLKKNLVQEEYAIQQSELRGMYLTRQERAHLWGNNAKDYEQKFLNAVRETAGLVIYYDNKIVDPPFFRLSNGKTRDGGANTYLQSVSCESDVLCESFLNKQVFSNKKFDYILKQIDKTEGQSKKITIKMDK